MNSTNKSHIDRELNRIYRKEEKLQRQAEGTKKTMWKDTLEQKVPEKVYTGLKKAFCKAFEIVFDKGTELIEKTYSKTEMEQDFFVMDYALGVKESSKEIREFKKKVSGNQLFHMALSTVEGVGLGALGIGMPDIIVFLSLILRSVYQTAVQYGFSYDTEEEKMLILKMMETSMTKGEHWSILNKQTDALMGNIVTVPTEQELKMQMERTADVFAADMLLAKFVQGLPVVGVFGGMTNPVYYNRVMQYVQLKYRKRYLLGKL